VTGTRGSAPRRLAGRAPHARATACQPGPAAGSERAPRPAAIHMGAMRCERAARRAPVRVRAWLTGPPRLGQQAVETKLGEEEED